MITSAPRAVRVSMSTAVCRVMCRQPAMRAPFRGLDWPYISRIFIRPGISFSAISMDLRPHSARLMSAAENRGGKDIEHVTCRFYIQHYLIQHYSKCCTTSNNCTPSALCRQWRNGNGKDTVLILTHEKNEDVQQHTEHKQTDSTHHSWRMSLSQWFMSNGVSSNNTWHCPIPKCSKSKTCPFSYILV